MPAPTRSRTGRARVLQCLRLAPEGLGVAEIAAGSGLHANTVRFHLERLVAGGTVVSRAEPRSDPGRPRLTYAAVAAPGGDGDKRDYEFLSRILAGLLTDALPEPAVAATTAGRRWGSLLADKQTAADRTAVPGEAVDDETAIARLGAILADVGFDPEVSDAEVIRIHHCPFLEVARDNQQVACSVHLGLMQGALERMGSTVTADRLLPLVEPTLCLATLARRTPR